MLRKVRIKTVISLNGTWRRTGEPTAEEFRALVKKDQPGNPLKIS